MWANEAHGWSCDETGRQNGSGGGSLADGCEHAFGMRCGWVFGDARRLYGRRVYVAGWVGAAAGCGAGGGIASSAVGCPARMAG